MAQRLQPLLTGRATSRLIVGGGLAYVLFAGWLMATAKYDLWGALVALPFIAGIGVAMTRKILGGDLSPLQRAAMIGLGIKLAGTLARYWVANDAYGGTADSTGYHNTGKIIAGELWDGTISIVELMPHTLGTRFVDELTGLLYALVGSSKLAGFLWFGLAGYTGTVLTVKAGCLAVPGLARTRYALLCFLMPTLVFWPSSIGKEAWMSLVLGIASMGAARLFSGLGAASALPWLVCGLVGAVMVRPHMAAIWLAAMVLALMWSGLSRRASAGRRSRPVMLAFLTAAASGGLLLIAEATAKYLNPANEAGASVSSIFEMTSARTSTGGSSFAPVRIDGPIDYPYAVLRTLTRPLIWDVSTLATILPAIESMLLLSLLVLWRRNVAGLVRQLSRTPYVLYAALICVMGAIAFSTFGNLAILVRQRSLLMPMMMLLLCLPARQRAALETTPRSRTTTSTDAAAASTLSDR